MIRRSWLAAIALVAFGAGAPTSHALVIPPMLRLQDQASHPAFLDDFVKAVNEKDEAALAKILEEHFTTTVPTEPRARSRAHST